MRKRAFISLCIVLALIFGMCIGTVAAGGLETISAYLTYNTTVKLDGQTQTMYDGNGKQVYPINYQGTTYLPLRAVANMLGIEVNWDGATKTVLLGNSGEAKDFFEVLEPYAYNGGYPADEPKEIAGKTYKNYLDLGSSSDPTGEFYYDLGGKYETLTFKVYSEADWEAPVCIYGDNDELLEEIYPEPMKLPVTVSVDVTGVAQLVITGWQYEYLFDATIE